LARGFVEILGVLGVSQTTITHEELNSLQTHVTQAKVPPQ
jgi:hypothetical protein